MVLLGANPPGRCVEQHDFFFGIAEDLQALIPQLKAYWPDAGNTLHIDGWREINQVDGYQVKVVAAGQATNKDSHRLFFLNLGGYLAGELQELHFTVLTAQSDRKEALKAATNLSFFKEKSIKGNKAASAHIDEKFGLAVDEIHRIDDLLSPAIKAHFGIALTPNPTTSEDELHIGYLKIS